MLATDGRPTGQLTAWTIEPQLDGWRAQVAVDQDGTVTVRTRHGTDLTAKVPEVGALGDLGVSMVLDGEVVAGAGLPADFYGIAGAVAARHRRRALSFVSFDVLHVAGHDVTGYRDRERRTLFDSLAGTANGELLTVPRFAGDDLDVVSPAAKSSPWRASS